MTDEVTFPPIEDYTMLTLMYKSGSGFAKRGRCLVRNLNTEYKEKLCLLKATEPTIGKGFGGYAYHEIEGVGTLLYFMDDASTTRSWLFYVDGCWGA